MKRFVIPILFFMLATGAWADPPPPPDQADTALRLFKKKDFEGTLKAIDGLDQDRRASFSYMTGYSLLRLGKTEEAKVYFERSAADSLTGDAGLFQLMLILDANGDNRELLLLTGRLLDRFPYSPQRQEALLLRGKAFLETGLYLKAGEMLTDILHNGLASPHKALWLLAKSQEPSGKITEAFQTYKTLYLEHPQTPFADKAWAEMERMKKEHRKNFPPITRREQINRAGLMMANRMYKDAVAYIQGIKPYGLSKSEKSALLLSLGTAYGKLGQSDKAVNAVKDAAALRDKTTRPEALYHLAKIYWNKDDEEKTRELCEQIIKESPSNEQAAQARYILARMDESKGRKKEAVEKYDKIAAIYPSAKITEECLWHAALLAYITGDFPGAEKRFERLAARNHNTAPMARYWLINSMRAQGKNADEQQNLLATKYQTSYYAYLSANPEMFREPADTNGPDAALGEAASARIETLAATRIKEPRLDERNAWLLKSSRAWRDMGFDDTAKTLLGSMAGTLPPDSAYWLAREYYKARCNSCATKLLDAVKMDEVAPEDMELVMLMLYPVVQWDALLREANSAGVDPFLVLSVIRQESRYDPDALSSANAHGLMQLIPSTAERTGAKIGMTGITVDKLREPEINLRLGTRYLADIIKSENGALPFALGTYNAGPKFIEKLKQRLPTDDLGLFIEQIPYQETKDYVKKVLRNYLIYRRLYAGFTPPIPSVEPAPAAQETPQ
jgi:soluble lytic murein transglycosylase